MTKYAAFNEDGSPMAFYVSEVWGEGVPSNAIEISDDQWTEFLKYPGARKWDNGQVIEFNPPTHDIVKSLPSVTLWERMTEAEAEQVNAAMATHPFRTRQIFTTANTFRSDHELWPLLESMAIDLFGETRAAELLAAPALELVTHL